jgi:hypothetical protein
MCVNKELSPKSQVKSSQVKSRFKMAVAFPPPLVPIAGASDREGRSRRNRHHWIAPSRGIIPIFLFLIIAAHRGFNNVPFQEVYSMAMQQGSRPTMGAIGGMREGCYMAEVPVGSGDLRRRAPSARGPSPTSFGVLGLTRARQSVLARQQGRLARRRQEWSRAFLRCAPHTPPFISHACARACDTVRCGVDGGARGRRAAGAAEREGVCKVCHAGRRRRGRQR